MATPLTDVYDFFLTKVSDYSFVELNKSGDLEAVLFKHLRGSVVRFTACTKDLTIDTSTQSFVSDLDDYEKEIISTLMTISYVSNKILNVKNMEQILTDKEYHIYSTANHLSNLIKLKKELQSEASHLMTSYSLINGLEGLE